MTAPAAMLWHTYSGQAVDGWLVSEKLDGVRAIWDGARLLSRSGRTIAAPAWFTAGLPACALDGELYAGPGTLPRVQGLARRAVPDPVDWIGVQFWIFDAPAAPGGFAARLAALDAFAAALPPHARIVPHHACPDRAALTARYHATIAAGGEGLVARHPAGLYHSGQRVGDVLKIKAHPDNPLCLTYSGANLFSVAR